MRFIRFCLAIAILVSLPRVIYLPLQAYVYQRKAASLCRSGSHFILYSNERAKRATFLLVKSVLLNYSDWETHFFLGLAYSQLKDYENAKKSYLESLALNRGYARTHYNLGNAYFNMREYDRTIECYANALRINPILVQAKNNLEVANKRRGDGNRM